MLNQVYAVLCSILGLNSYKWSLEDEDASAEVLSDWLWQAISMSCGKGLIEECDIVKL